MPRENRTVLMLLAGLMILSGCAGTPTDTTPSPASIHSVPSTPPPEPASVEPTLAFAGNCANVITNAQLISVLGSAAATRPNGVFDRFWLPSAETGGGIRCAWYANASEEDRIPGADAVWADALASDLVPAATKEHYSTARCEGVYDGTVCHLGVEAAGTWTLVSTGLLEYNAEVAPEALAQLASFVSTNSREYAVPLAPVRTEARWNRPDCETLGTVVGLDLLFSHAVAGYWEGGPGAFDRILADVDLQIECPWVSEYLDEGDTWGALTVTVAPGSGWMWDEMARIEQNGDDPDAPPVTAQDVEIAGAAAARQLTDGEGQTMTVGTDGTNILRITSTVDADVQVAVAERVLVALNANGR